MITTRISRALTGVTVVGMLCAHHVSAQQITMVSPDNGSLSVGANLTGRQAIFTVSSQSSQSSSRTLTIAECSGQITSCSAPGSTGNFIQSINITVTFTSLAAGTGTIRLLAQGSTSSDQGSINVTVTPPYGVAVTPDGGTEPTRTANTGGYSAPLTVKNIGANANTYSFACSGVGGVTCGTLPTSVPLNPGVQTVVNMPYSVGAAGTGTLTLTASGSSGGVSDQGSFSVPIVSYGVAVTPDAQITPTRFSGTSGNSETFTVQNTGSTSNTYTFGCSVTGVVVCGTVPSAVTLNAFGQAAVPMPYNVPNAGTGTITLTATGTNASDAGSFSIPVAKTLSTISGGALSIDASFLLQETGDTYDAYGRVTQLTDARGNIARFDYAPSNTGPFPTKLTRVRDGTNDLVTEIAYDPNGYAYVSSIKDEAGTFRYFTYDGFGRLRQIQNNSHTPIKAYLYDYSRTAANGWVYQSATPNAVTDSTYLTQSPLKAVVSTAYIDGLGRPIQTVVRDGADYHVTATQYDLMGRTWRVWNPYRRQTAGYHAAFATAATDSAVNYHGTANAKPYVETQYRPDPLGRVSRVIPQYFGTSPAVWKATSYGVDPTNRRLIVEAADELGKRTQDSSDVFGNVVRRVLGVGSINAVTAFTYNVVGQRTQSTDPRGLVTTYGIDTRGLQRSRTSPDAGTVNAKYDKAGNVRFTQDANQAAAGTVYFTNYDFANRPLVSGLGVASFAALNADVAEAFESPNANWLVVRQYDGMPPSTTPWNLFPTPPPLTNLNVRLVAVASKTSVSSVSWQVTYFSYDADGQLATRYTYTHANGGTSVLTALNTTVQYFRDLRGADTLRKLTLGTPAPNTFNQWYEYDGRGLLTKLFASTGSAKPPTPDVTDTLRPDGQPKNYQFQGGPLVPIRYTIRGQTEKVADPTLATCPTCPFAARYAYQANGVVDTAEFYSAGSPAAQKRYRYVFRDASGMDGYDALNRLKSADFWSWTGGAWTSTPAYDLAGITYDVAGNLLTLQRNRETGTPAWIVDNLTYNYAIPGTNRLSSVSEAAGTTTEPWDAEAGSFTYDPNGNLLTAPAAPYSIATAITYNHDNLPVSLTSGANTATYRYDDAGQRITKQVNGGNTEVYVRDGATTLGVVTVNGAGTPGPWHFNLVWEGRVIGRQPNTGNRRYYHFDHLGSTRAVAEGATVVESYDFEPWGLLMPGRTLAGPTKEGFTSEEQDAETGLDYFGARYYMPALGRWSSVDPVADETPGWSSYAYVLDSPLNATDPTGTTCVRLSTVAMECNNITAADLQEASAFAAEGSASSQGGQGQDPQQPAQQDPQRPTDPTGCGRCPLYYILKLLGMTPEEAAKHAGDAQLGVSSTLPSFALSTQPNYSSTVQAPIRIRNLALAGKPHPVTGVPFDRNGYPDFSAYATKTVKITQTGNRAADAAAANRAAGLARTPQGQVWHHHQDGHTMQLVPRQIHAQTGHTGGVATTRARNP